MRTLESQIGWCAKVQWVLAGATVLLVGGFYLFGYRPGASQRAGLGGQILVKERELASNQARTQIRPIVEQKVNESKRKVDRFDKRLPREAEFGPFIRDVTHLAQRTALRRWAYKTEPPKPTPDRALVELPITLTFEGDFQGVFAFLRHLEQLPRLTRIRDLSLRARPASGGDVDVHVSLAIYFSEG
jgi:Tfp pilus assembly protein PilO